MLVIILHQVSARSLLKHNYHPKNGIERTLIYDGLFFAANQNLMLDGKSSEEIENELRYGITPLLS